MMKQYFSNGINYDVWKKDPFLALILFRQLKEGFGWETFKKFFIKYQSMSANDSTGSYANSDQKKRDLWVSEFSKIAGKNIVEFFEKWGIPVSDKAKEEVSNLPI